MHIRSNSFRSNKNYKKYVSLLQCRQDLMVVMDRHRVKCDERHKEINSDYQETHTQNIHYSKKIKCSSFS